MPALVNQAEIWNALEQEGGGPLAILNTLLACRTKRSIDGLVATAKRTLVVPYAAVGAYALAYLHPASVIRLRRADGTWDDARITDINISSGGDGRITVTADDILKDLATKGQMISDSANGRVVYSVTKTDTPANLITFVLGFSPAYFQLGTVTPTTVITVNFNEMNPYQGMVAIAEAAFAATGTAYELSARRVGTFYSIDLQVLNGSASPADIRTGKNLGGLQRLQSSRDFAQRIVSMGPDSMGPGDNWWQVSSVSLNTYIRLIDINGGPSPLISIGPMTAYYIVDRADGKHAITASSIISAAECQFNMASTTNISAGDWVRIAFDASGNPVPYVDYAGAGGAFGVNLLVLRRSAPSRTNWFLNPDLKNWTGTTPDSWTKTGAGVIAKDTTVGNFLTGGASAKLTSTPITLSQIRNYAIPTVGSWYANWIAWFKVEPTGTPGTSTFSTYYDGGLTIPGGSIDLNASADGQWHTAYTSWKPGTGIHAFRLDMLLGRVMWFDSASLYFTEGSPIEIPFIAGSGGAASWLDSKAYISTMLTGAPYIYTGKVADLFKLVPEDAPYDELLLGKTDNITDSEIGDTLSPRVVLLDEDELDPMNTQVGWSTRRPEISKLLAR